MAIWYSNIRVPNRMFAVAESSVGRSKVPPLLVVAFEYDTDKKATEIVQINFVESTETIQEIFGTKT